MRFAVVAAVLLAVILAGCVERHSFERCRGDTVDWDAGTLCHDGRLREFILTDPEVSHDGPVPLLVALHGGAGDAANMQRKTNLDDWARQHGVLVVYPEGTPSLKGLDLRTWNAAHCCGKARTDGTDDVGFLDALVTAVQDRFPIDAGRIGATGHSNGGMMAHFWAASSDTVTHIMPVAGAVGGRTPVDGPLELPPEPGRAITVLIIHATDDPRVPYHGGQGENLGTQRHDTSVAEAVAFWEAGGSTVTVVAAEGGHGWPGGEADVGPAPAEPDASRLIV